MLAPGNNLDWKDCTMGTPARRILNQDGQEWPSYIQGQFESPALVVRKKDCFRTLEVKNPLITQRKQQPKARQERSAAFA